MDEKTEKYLAQLLEGYEANIGPIKAALDQMRQQREQLEEQRDQMSQGIVEIKALLNLDEEEDSEEEDSEEEEGTVAQ